MRPELTRLRYRGAMRTRLATTVGSLALGALLAAGCGDPEPAPGTDAPAAVDAAIDAAIDAPIDAPPNLPPQVGAIAGPTTLLAGASGTFAVVATDAEGDPLSYAWSASGAPTPGSWAAPAAASSAWFSGAIAAAGPAQLQVSVSDGVNPPVVQTLAVTVTVPHFTDLQPIFSMTCVACHGNSGGLRLEPANAYAELVGVATSNTACNTLVRVAPGAPDQSSLIRKMTGTTCGDRMPRAEPTYFDDNPGLVVRVRSWILAGALND